MMQAAPGAGLMAIAAALLCACTPSGTDSPTASARTAAGHLSSVPLAGTSTGPTHAYTDPAWGFQIDVPARWTIRHDFPRDYLANGAWKTFAPPDSSGSPVLALVVPGSDHVTDAELRIGASKSAQDVRDCMDPPQNVRAGSVGSVTINGTRFTRFDAGDAAMSHHLNVRSYRGMHDGACYAIDLLVYGVDPRVYDPPATPPFTDAQALARMQAVVETFRFQRLPSAATTAR